MVVTHLTQARTFLRLRSGRASSGQPAKAPRKAKVLYWADEGVRSYVFYTDLHLLCQKTFT